MAKNLKHTNAEVPVYLFKQGKNFESQKFFGAHFETRGVQQGVVFRVWAPRAKAVSVVGDFNSWVPGAAPMENLDEDGGIWECFVPGLAVYDIYKYCVTTPDDELVFKADPYAFHTETRPANCSKVYELAGYEWGDAAWQKKVARHSPLKEPVNIYEMHAGSWRTYEDGNPYNYRELAAQLVPYLQEMGYTHVELMPIMEHPFDGSWGYQVTGYFAPTSRYGTPHDFKAFVDACHQGGIGVIMDWVPAHFPKDQFGLYKFDGTNCYEDQNPLRAEHKEWGTMVFDYGRPEVQSFLISNALFWLEEYHVDGLRVDAVASMLYLDYNRRDGEWAPNKNGGKENLEAIEFLQRLNSEVFARHPHAMMIAEESTAWPLVSHPVSEGGLGFNFKWNMGWMHDFLEYMKLDPYFRKEHHNQMTFAMTYAYSEKYILVLSHDEVVHLKCSMLNKMPGLGFDKYANLKVGYAFMMGHPGKKLLFMGQDFAQLREWSEARELDWYLLEEPEHQYLQAFTRDLLKLYRKNKAMYEQDTEGYGFEWVNANDGYRSVFSFIRHSKHNKKNLLFVCNFTPMEWTDYRVGVPRRKQYKLILNSDDKQYGGKGEERPQIYKAVKQECDGRPYSFAYKLPPYGVAVFEF